jgi:hypothetical protein
MKYLGEYVSKSIMLELIVLNNRERGRRELGGREESHYNFEQVEMSGRRGLCPDALN